MARITVGNHLFVEAHQAWQVGCQTIEVVGGEQNRQSLFVQIGKQVQNLVTRAHVDTRCWFVHDQNVWLAKHCACQKDSLLLTTREFANMSVSNIGNAELTQHLANGCAFGCSNAWPPTGFCASHCNYFFNCDGEVPVDSFDLGYVANCQMWLQRDRAVRNWVGAHDCIEQRCLARTRWTNDAYKLTALDL